MAVTTEYRVGRSESLVFVEVPEIDFYYTAEVSDLANMLNAVGRRTDIPIETYLSLFRDLERVEAQYQAELAVNIEQDIEKDFEYEPVGQVQNLIVFLCCVITFLVTMIFFLTQ